MTGESLIELLHRGNYSCVIEKEGEVRTFQRKGIIDLYELFQTERSFLKGATVVDLWMQYATLCGFAILFSLAAAITYKKRS